MEVQKPGITNLMPSTFHRDFPPSVKNVLDKIDTRQLMRAKQEISERLGLILKRVNEALEEYTPGIEIELEGADDLDFVSQLISRKKRNELLQKLSMFLQTSSTVEGGLESILKWLLEWSEMLTAITSDEEEVENKRAKLDDWIKQQEEEVNRCLNATQKCIEQLVELYYLLTGNDLRIRTKFRTSDDLQTCPPENTVDPAHLKKIQAIHPPSAKQMLMNEAAAISTAIELYEVLQDIAVSPQCSEEQGSIYLCNTLMIRNLSRAFGVRSKEYHGLETEIIFQKTQKSKLKNQLMGLLKDLHDLREDKKLLQIKLQGMETKTKQLLLNIKTAKAAEEKEKLEQIYRSVSTDSEKQLIMSFQKKKPQGKKIQFDTEHESDQESDPKIAGEQQPEEETAVDDKSEFKKPESQEKQVQDFSTVPQGDESQIETATKDEMAAKTILDESDMEVAREGKRGFQKGSKKKSISLDSKKGPQKHDRSPESALDDGKGIQRADRTPKTARDDGKGIQRVDRTPKTALDDGKGIQRVDRTPKTALDDGKGIQRVDTTPKTALDDRKEIQRIDRATQTPEDEEDTELGIIKSDSEIQTMLDEMGFQGDESDAEMSLDERSEIQKRKLLLAARFEYLKRVGKLHRGFIFKKLFKKDESDKKITDKVKEDLVVHALEEFQRAILSFLDQKAETTKKPSDKSLEAKELLPMNALILNLYNTTEKKMEEILEKIKENICRDLKEQEPITPGLPLSTLELQETKPMVEDLVSPMLPEQLESSLLGKPSITSITTELKSPHRVSPLESLSASVEPERSEISQLPRLQEIAGPPERSEISQLPRLQEIAGPPSEDKSTWHQEKLQEQPEVEHHLPLSDIDQQVPRSIVTLETKVLTTEQLQKSMQELEVKDWLPAELAETEERYFLDVKSQRENLERLSKACRMLVLPSQLHTLARDLILKILDSDATRLAHLFRKYISFRLIQNVRQILTVRAHKAQSAGDVTALVGLYVFLDRLDSYQAKILHRWIDKQATTAETRSSCFTKMIYLFNKLRVNYKLHLFQPFPSPQFEHVKLDECDSPYKPRTCPGIPPTPYFKPKLPGIQQEQLVTKFRKPKYKMTSIWKPHITDESFRFAKKQPLLEIWSKAGAFPDVPRLLQLDVHFSKNKALQSLQRRIQEFSS
ncbi:protein FAM186A isoform X2 [Rhinatrema bivittatum]|uniref:protein FAM186A isoform X2 n=1 Tax=Rhinatrema bivittatum TaxID=194408 RepID=UPI00112D5ACB|nr:protein FAM186A isoform X2 [Rhinatrema bivittatum]